MTVPDLRPAFPHAVPITSYTNAAQQLQLCDPELFEGCGYATKDEAGILFTAAEKFGGDWLELGSHTGWTGSHIILGGAASYTGLDPEYSRACFNKTKDPSKFLNRTRDNIKNAVGSLDRVTLLGVGSHEIMPQWINEEKKFDFIFVDANHDSPYPVVDAILSDLVLKENGAVFFHDAIGAPVQAAVEYVRRKGYKIRFYDTAQIMAVAFKGSIELPPFEPSTSYDWNGHMNSYVRNTDMNSLNLQIRQAELYVDTLLLTSQTPVYQSQEELRSSGSTLSELGTQRW